MKQLLPLALFALLATGSTAMASTKSLNEFPTGIMPVLVQVDAFGRVTDASPPTRLSPQLDRLLRKNLAEMVSKPATDRHGHPIASQVIIN
jgi:type IV secretory pathway TrbF-like protein